MADSEPVGLAAVPIRACGFSGAARSAFVAQLVGEGVATFLAEPRPRPVQRSWYVVDSKAGWGAFAARNQLNGAG